MISTNFAIKGIAKSCAFGYLRALHFDSPYFHVSNFMQTSSTLLRVAENLGIPYLDVPLYRGVYLRKKTSRPLRLALFMSPEVPSSGDFFAYKGAHSPRLWAEVGPHWTCPACKRDKFQILRWTTRNPRSPNAYQDWLAVLHKHHDHSVDRMFSKLGRFPPTIICDQCNMADGRAKKKLKLPAEFSFSPP